MDTANTALLTRLELLEREIAEIKKKLLTETPTSHLSIRGLWKDIDISEGDIEEAKKSVFRNLDDI